MRLVPAFLLLVALSAQAADQPEVRFITCPIYRDTDAGRKSGCWLAEDPQSGQRYDVSLAPSKPDWNFAILVEGRVAAKQDDACGGTVLDPARTSILPQRCPRRMIPAEGYPGRRFALPARTVAPLTVKPVVPAGPFEARSFHIYFDFDSDFVSYQYGDYLLDQAARWLKAAAPKKIQIVGWAATGSDLAEHSAVARHRAEKIATSLTRLGIDQALLDVSWHDRAAMIDDADADHLREPSRRRVDIVVSF